MAVRVRRIWPPCLQRYGHLAILASHRHAAKLTRWEALRGGSSSCGLRGNRLAIQFLLSRRRDSLRPFRLEDDLVLFRKPLCFHAEQHESRAIFGDVFCDFVRKNKAQCDSWPESSYVASVSVRPLTSFHSLEQSQFRASLLTASSIRRCSPGRLGGEISRKDVQLDGPAFHSHRFQLWP